jgi:RNA polymerase sigma-70 factor (ECF subfamily)
MNDSKADKLSWMHAELGRLGAPLLRHATRITGDAERGRDVVQDTYLRLWESDGVRLDGQVRDWLFRVCHNRAVDVRRRERHLRPVGASEHVQEPAREGIERRPDLARVLEAARRLPDRQQAVLRLRFARGMSYREIAEETGLTVTHVGNLIHVAIRAIRSRLELDAKERS